MFEVIVSPAAAQPKRGNDETYKEAAKRAKMKAVEKLERSINTTTIAASTRTEVNPWLDRNGWAHYLKGYNCDELSTLLIRPGNDERPLLRIEKRIQHIIKVGQRIVLDETSTEARFAANRRDKNIKPVEPLKADMLPSTLTRYMETLLQVVRYAYRTFDSEPVAPEAGHLSKYPPYYLTAMQRRETAQLVQDLEEDDDRLASSDEDGNEQLLDGFDKRLLDWLLNMFRGKLSARRGGDFDNVVLSALAVIAIGQGGTWLSVLDYTPKLSALVKMVQIMIILQSFIQHDILTEGNHDSDVMALDYSQ